MNDGDSMVFLLIHVTRSLAGGKTLVQYTLLKVFPLDATRSISPYGTTKEQLIEWAQNKCQMGKCQILNELRVIASGLLDGGSILHQPFAFSPICLLTKLIS